MIKTKSVNFQILKEIALLGANNKFRKRTIWVLSNADILLLLILKILIKWLLKINYLRTTTREEPNFAS